MAIPLAEVMASAAASHRATASDIELLGRIVGKDSAKKLIAAAGTLPALARFTEMEIAAVLPEKAALWASSAIELGRRLQERPERGADMNSAAMAARYFKTLLGHLRIEEFHVALIDVKHRLIRSERIAIGSAEATLVHPREAFAPAVLAHAKGIIFAHNHPSGDTDPSEQDRSLTRRLVAAGDVLGIVVLDHIIVSQGDWYSFAEAGGLRL